MKYKTLMPEWRQGLVIFSGKREWVITPLTNPVNKRPVIGVQAVIDGEARIQGAIQEIGRGLLGCMQLVDYCTLMKESYDLHDLICPIFTTIYFLITTKSMSSAGARRIVEGLFKKGENYGGK